MASLLRPALLLLLLLTVVTGAAYPALVTGLAQGLFPEGANGSLVRRHGRVVGSGLIGQLFADAGHFWGRPSALAPRPYDASNSTGSNLGPTNPELARAVGERIAALRASDPGNAAPIPVDLVTASASGLDPHVSPAGALWQVARVARARGLPEERVRALVLEAVEPPALGLLGAPRVNVLRLNLALEEAAGGGRVGSAPLTVGH
jgi:K+-transporting ATPase ATPase C chain